MGGNLPKFITWLFYYLEVVLFSCEFKSFIICQMLIMTDLILKLILNIAPSNNTWVFLLFLLLLTKISPFSSLCLQYKCFLYLHEYLCHIPECDN
jgi:hypothetical protein